MCFGVAACSCGDGIHEIEKRAGGFADKTSGVTYKFAPMAYEPTAYEKEAFGKDEYDDTYHRVSFTNGSIVNTSQWLYAKYDALLAYNEKNVLPSFDELEVNLVNICVENTSSIIMSTIDKQNEIEKLTDLFKNGVICKYDVAPVSDSYSLKFVSGKYPIAYSITYIEYEEDHIEYEEISTLDGYEYREGVDHTVEEREGGYVVIYNYGKYFIYDRSTKICRVAGYIHSEYIG